MAEPFPDSPGEADIGDGGSAPATPTWVKVFAIILIVAVVVLVILMLTQGPGGHGPGRHTLGSLVHQVTSPTMQAA